MHFSCIRTLSFLYICFGLWRCVSVFLPLALSRIYYAWHLSANLLRLFNPLHSGTSSSDPTPTHIRFCDEKAHKDFSKNFSKRGIHLECHVILSGFFNTALPNVIHTRGWESLYEIPVSCPIVILQEFTPICMVSIPLCLNLLRMSQRYTYCSHSGSCIQDTRHSAGNTSWLPHSSMFKDCVQRRAHFSLLWETFHIRWSSKHSMLGFCKRSEIP